MNSLSNYIRKPLLLYCYHFLINNVANGKAVNKFSTFFQTQFVIVLIHSLNVTLFCDFNKFLSGLAATYAIIMIVLFSNYYYQQYVRKIKAKKKSTQEAQTVKTPAIDNHCTSGAKHQSETRKRIPGFVSA